MNLREKLKSPLKSPVWNRILFFVFAAVIGGVVGLATVGLIQLILLVQFIGYGEASEMRFAQIAASLPAWHVILVPTVGGLLVGLLMEWLPGKRYHGIADVMEACALNSARMSVRSGIGAALAAGLSIGVGAPLGREGPAVHIGASLSAWIAEKLGLDRRQSLALLGCGAAAAVTVSFDTPIAAVIFALEVIVGYYTLRVFAPIVIATMVAVVVREVFFGGEVLFYLPDYSLTSYWELVLFAMLGIFGAGASWLVIQLVVLCQKGWGKVPVPGWLRPAIAGCLIGIIAVELPMILSVGTDATGQALRGDMPINLLLALLVFKVLTVGLAIGSGFAGGVFSPALYIGALLGGCFWFVVSITGINMAEQGVYAVVGTAAVASAMLGAPISTILIVFELTRNYEITLGVMTAAAFASTTMSLTGHGSFFRWQLSQRAVNISSGRDISLLMTHRIKHLVHQRYTTVTPDNTIGELESKMNSQRQRLAMIADDNGVFHGSLTLQMVVLHATQQGSDHPATAAAFDAEFSVSTSMNIVTALQRMAEQQVEYLPVVDDSDKENHVLIGIVTKSDLLAEHYDVVKREREAEFGIT